MNSIYKITNTVNGKVYIGQTWGLLSERFQEHCRPSSNCTFLKNAIVKYGKTNFTIEFITLAHTQKVADYWETYFIKRYDSMNRNQGYNLREAGSHGKWSQTIKDKISESNTGQKRSDETKQKQAAIKRGLRGMQTNNFGTKLTTEQRANIAKGANTKGKTWKLVNGTRVWMQKGQV